MRAARGESSAAVAGRVAAARAVARARLAGTPWTLNSQVPGSWFRERLRGRGAVLQQIDDALDAGLLTLRGADRVLRLAFTVADLADGREPVPADIGLALTLRTGRFA
jgi:magnesium chelatase family protein